MKRLTAFLLAAFLLAPLLSFAAGTCSQSMTSTTDAQGIVNAKFVTVICTGDITGSTTGAFPATALNLGSVPIPAGWYLYQAQTKPGTTAPSAFSITLVDAYGYDIAGGLLASRSVSAAQTVLIGLASAGYPIVDPTGFTITPTGNSTASATFTLVLKFVK